MQVAGWVLLAALATFSAVGTWLSRRYALKRKLMDAPGERRSHAVATPRGGGVAIVAAVLAACAYSATLWPQQGMAIAAFAGGLVLVAGIGWWDDHRPLSAALRLLVHALAATLLAGLVYRLHQNPWLAALTWLATISLINIWNFMDGINGLATSQAMLVALGFAVLLPAPLRWPCWVLIVACAGFLPFNYPRARIFLGDVGSGALGYLVAALFALGNVATELTPWLLLIPISAFVIDAGFTLLSRMLAGERWWQPHAQHFYQRWVHTGRSHTVVTFAYALFSIVAITIAWFGGTLRTGGQVGLAFAWYLSASALWLTLRKGLR
ncbi:LPS biosynthesis protein [Xanthomonas sp. GW]|uniref:MraY family glycosyltransferase n=1 Tax=Xanthomonas sp. GW TaxID=2724121 RepID=UPI00163A8087|nr:glycosyltransferase family 4 protein [Xanthomonas sp. GW]QNH21129.1 LPS biosynthesis protein [Xanthomonas sp. GW]